MAGTQVWVLKEGRDPAQASEAVSQGDAIENWAEREEIEDIKVGDWALSRDEDAFVGATHVSPARATKSLCFGYVSETYQNTTNELISLTLFDSQTGATETLEVTPGHPFWVSETGSSSGEAGNPVRRSLGEGGWTFAGELAERDELTSATGHALTVAAVKHTQRQANTFNFAVSHAHTYFVGSTPTWTHNASEQRRDAAGKFLPKGGGEVQPGSNAVAQARESMEKRGWKILGEEISFADTKSGQVRRYDIVAKSPSGAVVGIEVKSGGARRTGAQKEFDMRVNRSQGASARPVGAKAANIPNIRRSQVVRPKKCS